MHTRTKPATASQPNPPWTRGGVQAGEERRQNYQRDDGSYIIIF